MKAWFRFIVPYLLIFTVLNLLAAWKSYEQGKSVVSISVAYLLFSLLMATGLFVISFVVKKPSFRIRALNYASGCAIVLGFLGLYLYL
jgi:predicted permease